MRSFLKIIAVVALVLAFIHSAGFSQPITQGALWQQVKAPVPGEVISLSVTTDLIVAGTNSGLFVSTSGSDSWKRIPDFVFDTEFAMTFANNEVALAGSRRGRIYRSIDNGQTWSVTQQLVGVAIDGITKLGNILYCGTNIYKSPIDVTGKSLYRSLDTGRSWEVVADVPMVVNGLATSGTQLVAAFGRGIGISVDFGLTWTVTPLDYHAASVAVSGSTMIVGSASPLFLLYSSDNGVTWLRGQPYDEQHVYGVAAAGKYGFAVSDIFSSSRGHVYESSDRGANWKNVTDDLPLIYVYSLSILDTTVYIGGDNGIWKRVFPELAGISNVKQSSVQSEISIYPNPISDQATISFTTQKAAQTSIVMENDLGVAVATIYSDILPAGDHEFKWMPTNLTSGIYWCTIKTSGSITRKIVVKV